MGIEFIASESPGEIAKHAKRDYPHALKLGQYVVVSFATEIPSGGFSPYFSPGVDKDNKACDIQIYHVLHDKLFTKASLFYKATSEDSSPTKVKIL